MRLDLSVREWIALLSVLERKGTDDGDADAIYLDAIRNRIRAITGRALQSFEVAQGPSQSDRWLDNQKAKVEGLVPPPVSPGRPVSPYAPTQPASLRGLAAQVPSIVELEDVGGVEPNEDTSDPDGYYAERRELYEPPSESDLQSPDFLAAWSVIRHWAYLDVPSVGVELGQPGLRRAAMAVVRSMRSRWDFESDSKRGPLGGE